MPGTGIATELKARIKKLSRREIDDLFWDDLQDLYEQRPVDIDTFLENPYFMGEHFADPNTGRARYILFGGRSSEKFTRLLFTTTTMRFW